VIRFSRATVDRRVANEPPHPHVATGKLIFRRVATTPPNPPLYMTTATVYTFSTGVASDAGTRYRQPVTEKTQSHALTGVRMEDSHVILKYRNNIIVALADGHGSVEMERGVHVGGREAADSALAAVQTHARKCVCHAKDVFDAAHEAVRIQVDFARHTEAVTTEADGAITVRKANGTLETAAHGTTLCIMSVSPTGDGHVAYVGDTMCVVVPDGETSAFFAGAPHTVANKEEASRMIAAGAKKWRARHLQMKIGPKNDEYVVQLTRSLGHFGNRIMTHEPTELRWKAGWKAIVVATDGIWDHVSIDRCASICKWHPDAQMCANAILAEAVRSAANKPRDNATVVVVMATPQAPVADEVCRCSVS
jgi:serine/threonine protein phosphatase PrpC